MSKPTNAAPSAITDHALARMEEREINEQDLADAAADAFVVRQAGGRREVRGRNGVSFITDSTGEAVLTVLPRGARPAPTARRDSGVSRHRADRRGPKGRNDRQRPRR
jgi:hypothetical protein